MNPHETPFLGRVPEVPLRVCGVVLLLLPLLLSLLAYLCHRAAILPSVLPQNQVLDALWLGSRLFLCSQASLPLSQASLCLNEPN